MQRDENEREQDPVYGRGGEEPPSSEIGSQPEPVPEPGQEPPVYTAGEQPPPYPADTGKREHGADGQPTDAIWFGSQPSAPAAGGQPPPGETAWQPSGTGYPPPGGETPGGPWGIGSWGAPPQPPPRRARRLLSFVIVAILGVGIGAAAAFGIAHNRTQQTANPGVSAVPTPGSQRPPLQSAGTSKINVQAIANAVSPSVANVTGQVLYQNATQEGTGIVINSSGLVLTNNHVVSGARRITVDVGGSSRTYTARVLGTDKANDVALLQLQGASGLKAAPIGNSSKVAIGDPVVAIGNLGGQGGSPTVTSGTITALNRTITAGDQGSANNETLRGVLQTDAPIGSGDSGGPLVNASGQVIGMDTAAATNNAGQSESIGFAIPINNALSIAREIAAGHGSSTIQIGLPAFLGVQVCNISQASQCMSNGLGFGNTSVAPVSAGALVAGVLNGTPAQSAGMASGDVITSLDGTSVTSAESLTKAMRSHHPGDQVSVTWVDTNGQRHTATVKLITGPAS